MADNIIEYNAPDSGLTPSNTGEAAFQLEGRRAGQIGNERAAMINQQGEFVKQSAEEFGKLGKEVENLGGIVEKHQTAMEHIKGLHEFSDAYTALNQSMEDHAKNGDLYDPTVMAKWRENVLTPAISKLTENYATPGGKAFAAEQGAKLATEFYRQSTAVEANRSMDAVHVAVKESANLLTAQAIQNPSSLDYLLSTVDDRTKAIVDALPSIKAEDRSKVQLQVAQDVKRHIVLNTIQNIIDRDPAQGDALAHNPKYASIIGGDISELDHRTQSQKHLVLENENLQQNMSDRQDRQNYNQKLNDIYATAITPNGIVIPPDFLQKVQDLARETNSQGKPLGRLEPDAAKNAVDWAKAISTEQASGKLDVTDKGIRDSFNTRMFNPTNPLTLAEVDTAKANHMISDADWQHYRASVNDMQKMDDTTKIKINDTFASMQKEIIGGGGMMPVTQWGNWKANAWLRFAQPAFAGYIRGGMSVDEALDKVTSPAIIDKYRNMIVNSSDVLEQQQQNTGTKTHTKSLEDHLK